MELTRSPDHQDSPLIELGFTDLEAQAYMHLLAAAPDTGYGIAKALCKPAANTYKALESLQRKGAVMVDEGDPRLYRPIAPEQLLGLLEQRFQRLRSQAGAELAELHRGTRDDRVYRMRSADQVMEKAREMLRKAQEVVLVDAFPEAVEALRDALEQAVGRGVQVGLKAYAPTELDGARVVVGRNAEVVRQRWPGRWLNLVTDGAGYLMALLGADGATVVQAIWTECPYLSWVYQSAFSSELILSALDARLEQGASAAELKELRDALWGLKRPGAPGYRAIMQDLDAGGDEGGR